MLTPVTGVASSSMPISASYVDGRCLRISLPWRVARRACNSVFFITELYHRMRDL